MLFLLSAQAKVYTDDRRAKIYDSWGILSRSSVINPVFKLFHWRRSTYREIQLVPETSGTFSDLRVLLGFMGPCNKTRRATIQICHRLNDLVISPSAVANDGIVFNFDMYHAKNSEQCSISTVEIKTCQVLGDDVQRPPLPWSRSTLWLDWGSD